MINRWQTIVFAYLIFWSGFLLPAAESVRASQLLSSSWPAGDGAGALQSPNTGNFQQELSSLIETLADAMNGNFGTAVRRFSPRQLLAWVGNAVQRKPMPHVRAQMRQWNELSTSELHQEIHERLNSAENIPRATRRLLHRVADQIVAGETGVITDGGVMNPLALTEHMGRELLADFLTDNSPAAGHQRLMLGGALLGVAAGAAIAFQIIRRVQGLTPFPRLGLMIFLAAVHLIVFLAGLAFVMSNNMSDIVVLVAIPILIILDIFGQLLLAKCIDSCCRRRELTRQIARLQRAALPGQAPALGRVMLGAPGDILQQLEMIDRIHSDQDLPSSDGNECYICRHRTKLKMRCCDMRAHAECVTIRQATLPAQRRGFCDHCQQPLSENIVVEVPMVVEEEAPPAAEHQ